MGRNLLRLISICALVASTIAADKPDRDDVVSKLRSAAAKTNIFELPSFKLRAKVEIDEGSFSEVGGYELLWEGPDRWREEILLPNHHELQIGNKGDIWVQRKTDFVPLAVYRIHEALGFGSTSGSAGAGDLIRFAIPSNAVLKNQHRWKEHGDPLTCFEFEHEYVQVTQNCRSSATGCFPGEYKQKRKIEACLNDRTSTLARDYRFFDDEDLLPVGAKTFPRRLRSLWHGGTIAKITITELSSPSQSPPEAFAVPGGVSPESGCMNPDPPILLKRVDPIFDEITDKIPMPYLGPANVVIDTDGAVKSVRILDLTEFNSQFDSPQKKALTGWRYEPAACNGTPTRFNTVIY